MRNYIETSVLVDIVVEAAASSQATGTLLLHEIDDSGLSTIVDDVRDRHAGSGWAPHDVEVPTLTMNQILENAQWQGLDIHFMTIDVEGAEGDVLASIDLTRWRPWVLVVESTAPMTTEQTHEKWEPALLSAEYVFCLFDGVSRYYVAKEHSDELGAQLSYSPSVFDRYQTHDQRTLMSQAQSATEDAVRWRTIALTRWSEVVAGQVAENKRLAAEVAYLSSELQAIQQTVSWRVTTPLRAVRRRSLSGPTIMSDAVDDL